MKKLLSLLLVMLLIVGTFAACNNTPATSSTPSSSTEDSIDNTDPSDEPSEEPSDEPSEEPYEEPSEEPYEEPSEDGDDFGDDWGDEDPIIDEDLPPEEARKISVLSGEDEQLNKDALYNEGNLNRLAQVIRKSKQGKTVTIIFYGNAANTSLNHDETPVDNPYTELFKNWWNQNIGPCEVKRAGMDNLTSFQACMRVDNDVLQYKPDLVFLDFAVQDGLPPAEGNNYTIGYDNLCRRLIHSSVKPAVVSLVLTGAEQQGYAVSIKNADMFASNSKQEKIVAKYYSLPIIDFETALWETMIKLVKVTPQTEYPVMSWADVGASNVVMNNDGHLILFGTIRYFFEQVLGKLSSIPTTEFAYPTKGQKDNNTYMNGTFINMKQLYDIGVPGYKLGIKTDTGYGYRGFQDNDSRYPFITTHRPTEPIELIIPKVGLKERCYFMVQTPSQTVDGGTSPDPVVKAYTPYRFDCYDENGVSLRNVKPQASPYKECYRSGRTNAGLIPVNTTKIIIRCWTGSGYIRLLGIGYFDKAQ